MWLRGVRMNDIAAKIFCLCCRDPQHQLMSFTEFPPLRKIHLQMEGEQKEAFFRAMDQYETEAAKYSEFCFYQGIYCALSLLQRIQPCDEG